MQTIYHFSAFYTEKFLKNYQHRLSSFSEYLPEKSLLPSPSSHILAKAPNSQDFLKFFGTGGVLTSTDKFQVVLGTLDILLITPAKFSFE